MLHSGEADQLGVVLPTFLSKIAPNGLKLTEIDSNLVKSWLDFPEEGGHNPAKLTKDSREDFAGPLWDELCRHSNDPIQNGTGEESKLDYDEQTKDTASQSEKQIRKDAPWQKMLPFWIVNIPYLPPFCLVNSFP